MLRFFKDQRLLSRVFLHGLVVLVASAITFGILSGVLLKPRFDHDALIFGKWMAPQLCKTLTDPRFAKLDEPEFAATAYSEGGVLLGTFANPPLPPLSSDELSQLRLGRSPALSRILGHAFACPDATGGAYVVFGPPRPPWSSARLVFPFMLVIVVVALASLPFARSIARPLEQVVGVTQAFGRGELSVRAETSRPDEVGDLARAFNDMAERLERLIRAEKELLANVSHELRTPLARIRVVLETALEHPKRSQDLLAEIAKDLADLERLTENVMEAMRLDMGTGAFSGGQLPAHLEPTDVCALVFDAVARFRDVHPGRQIEIDAARAPAEAHADARLLRRLLDNLLENAVKYSDERSSIVVRIGGDTKVVRIEVADSGIGIDPQDLPHVFEPFFRSDRSRARTTGGTGLGLALAKRIADVHGGTIIVRSQIGEGTTVSFALNCRPAEIVTDSARGSIDRSGRRT